jgi:hypothetical protein
MSIRIILWASKKQLTKIYCVKGSLGWHNEHRWIPWVKRMTTMAFHGESKTFLKGKDGLYFEEWKQSNRDKSMTNKKVNNQKRKSQKQPGHFWSYFSPVHKNFSSPESSEWKPITWHGCWYPWWFGPSVPFRADMLSTYQTPHTIYFV